MKQLLGRSVTTSICIGALVITAQTWGYDDEKKVLTKTTEVKATVKKQTECEKPCKINYNDSITQKNEPAQDWNRDSKEYAQHQHEDSSEMLKMDDSNVKTPTKFSK